MANYEKYISKRYLREKWEKLKWDMERTLNIYDTQSDRVDNDRVKDCKEDIKLMCKSILTELGE